MDFIEVLRNISSKIIKQKDLINTEEATKNAFVMPFISALGYDVFDPSEVIPEFTADVGIKKGEKVDYAIKHPRDAQREKPSKRQVEKRIKYIYLYNKQVILENIHR